MESAVNLPHRSRNCPVIVQNTGYVGHEEMLKICRGCLSFDVKLFNLFDIGLANDFEELVSTGTYCPEGLPTTICSYCACLLLKAMAFRRRCRSAQQALHSILADHLALTKQNLSSIEQNTKLVLTKTELVSVDYNPSKNEINGTVSRPENVTTVKDDLSFQGFESDTSIADVKEIFIDTSNPLPGDGADVIVKDEQTDELSMNGDSDYDSDIKLNLLVKKEECKRLKRTEKKKLQKAKSKKGVKRKAKTEIVKKEEEKKRSKRKNEEYSQEMTEIYRLPKKSRLEQFSKEYEVDIVMLTKEQQIAELQEKKNSDKYKNASLKCGMCYKGFAVEKSYKQHMARHDESRGEFECEICSFRFKSRRRVLAHAREYHVFNYTCKICNKTYKNPHWARFHYKMHQGEKPTCKQCGQQFAHPSVLQVHVRKSHGSARCPICDAVCAKASSVPQHIALVHKVNVRKSHGSARCPICDAVCAKASSVPQHIALVHKVQQVDCEHCGVKFESPEALAVHLSPGQTDGPGPDTTGSHQPSDRTGPDRADGETIEGARCGYGRACGVCGCSFAEDAFDKHKQFCTPPKPPKKDFKCQQCYRPFASAQSLRNHMNYYHKRDPATDKCVEVGTRKRGRKKGSKVDRNAPPKMCPYPTLMCEICGKNNFKFKSALRIHQSTHSRERPFKCDVCDKTFKLQMHLKLHMAVHTGEKRYECSVCAKKFRQHAHLAQHMVLHTNEMPFSCELCGKRFRFQGSHWQHMRAHEGIHRARAHPRGRYGYGAEDTFDSL